MQQWKQAVLATGVVVVFLMKSPTLLDITPCAYNVPYLPLTGALEINNKLGQSEHLFQETLRGPESVVIHKGEIITGTEDGRIVKIQGNDIIPMAQTGRDCDMPHEERLCGRPLGLRMWKDGLLYVADGYYGLHSVNISTGSLTRLLSTNTFIEGQKLVFPDDLDIDDSGNVYFSDASAKWDLSGMFYMLAEHEGSGRVIRHNIYSGESEVMVRDLFFPNGIQLSQDGNSLLICEIMKLRILRYHLKGSKKGQLEVFIDKLPGEPDNIRLGPRGTYWVALVFARNHQSAAILYDFLSQYPLIRKFATRALHATGSLLMALADLSSSRTFKEFAYKLRRGDYLIAMVPSHGMIIELDGNGNVLRSFQAPDGSTHYLSSVIEHDGYLYLGSFFNRYLGKLKL